MATMASVVASDFSLMKLPSSTPVGGKCLDGTQAGFYFREGVNPSLFVINLEGGGSCSSKRECASRAKTNLGSSNYWTAQPPALDVNLLLNGNCSQNPDFCNAMTIDIPYCTGDVHTGTRTTTSDDTWGYIFDGHHNFVAIIDMLIADYGLGDATQVLLTGVSAGGIGAFWNVDYLADRLPSAIVKAAPIAGWYLPGPLENEPASMYAPSDYQHFAAGAHGTSHDDPFQTGIWGSHELIPRDCVADYGDAYLASCTTMHNRYKYTKSPVYVIQTQYDPTHIFVIGGAPERPSLNEIDSTEAYIDMIGDATRSSLEQITNGEAFSNKPHPDGLFEASCLHHNMPVSLEISGLHFIPLLNDWFFQKNEFQGYHQLVETCPYKDGETKLPCNVVENCKFQGRSSPTPINPSENTCRSGLETKKCMSSESGQMCLKCAEKSKEFLIQKGCTVAIVKQTCKELGTSYPLFSEFVSNYEIREQEWYTQWPSTSVLYIAVITLVGILMALTLVRTFRAIGDGEHYDDYTRLHTDP
jgi:hypothetical protein